MKAVCVTLNCLAANRKKKDENWVTLILIIHLTEPNRFRIYHFNMESKPFKLLMRKLHIQSSKTDAFIAPLTQASTWSVTILQRCPKWRHDVRPFIRLVVVYGPPLREASSTLLPRRAMPRRNRAVSLQQAIALNHCSLWGCREGLSQAPEDVKSKLR